MKQSNSALNKIDIFWSIFAIVFISAAVFFWQAEQYHFSFMDILLATIGIVNSIKKLIPKKLYNILRVSVAVAALLYLLIIIIIEEEVGS